MSESQSPRVAIVGSRDFPDLSRIRRFVQSLAAKHPGATVVSGGARGVDLTAEGYARREGLSVLSFRPTELEDKRFGILRCWNTEPGELLDQRYSTYGQACYARNILIVEHTEQVVAFWDGKSKGTDHTLTIARTAGRPVHVYT